MTRDRQRKLLPVFVLSLLALAAPRLASSAENVKIKGMIKSRSGATMTVQSADASSVVVVLHGNTEVGQVQGVLKARRKEMSMAALIPGLEVQVEGSYDDQHQLVAKSVKFQGDDLERAQAIQAGLHETQGQAARNSQELEKQNERIAANQASIQANQASIQAAAARFGQLDDYYILDEVTVLFPNGKSDVDPKYKTQLLELAKKAKTIEAYIVQVVGYASSSGSAKLNQKLSEDRAANVSNLLIQDGDIPLTNILAPGAMGESRQIGDDQSAEGQAQNRRVVVRILQNKGIAGHSDHH